MKHGSGVSYVYRASKVFVPHQYVRHGESKDDGADPRSNKTLDSLLR